MSKNNFSRRFLFSFFLFFIAQTLLLHKPGEAASLNDPATLLVGVHANNNERGTVEMLMRDGLSWISLTDISRIAGMRIEPVEGGGKFFTPIGSAFITEDELVKRDKTLYISGSTLLSVFNIAMTFHELEFALYFDIPWRPGASLEKPVAGESKKPPEPEILAPKGSLGFVRSFADYEYDNDTASGAATGNFDMGGNAYSGTWLLGLSGKSESEASLERLFWNKIFPHIAFRAGLNHVNQNPLLTSFDFAGLQAAYSNRGITRYTDFETNLNFESFLAEDINVSENIIRYDGPPGGIAELRIDDKPVARVRIGLDGHYEFRNIERKRGAYQTIKVFLYKRRFTETPVAQLDLTRSTARQALPKGEVMIRAGGGARESYEDENRVYKNSTAFLQGRYGLFDNLTVLGIAQSVDEKKVEQLTGLRLSLGKSWAIAFDAATLNDAWGTYAELNGFSEKGELWFRSQSREPEYRDDQNIEEYDNYLRSYYRMRPWFGVGLFGRQSREEEKDDIEYLLPGANFRPSSTTMLSVTPNMDGIYRATADYYHSAYTRFSISHEADRTSALLFLDSVTDKSWLFGYDYDDRIDGGIFYTNFYWFLESSHENFLRAGLSYTGSQTGFFASWSKVVTPGVEYRLEYFNGYLQDVEDKREERFLAAVRLDFALTGKRLAPVDNSMMNFARGSVAGSVYDEQGNIVKTDGVEIRIDGLILPQRFLQGRYYIGGLKPGVYTVEIDEEKLPIEYAPVRKSYQVQVATLSVTEVNFHVERQFGVAGKVTTNGAPVKGAMVEATDFSGAFAGKGITGLFGYYRIDGLTPGDYTLTVTDVGDGRQIFLSTTRPINIRDDFLYDQDMDVATGGE